jgi:hypothetical protein
LCCPLRVATTGFVQSEQNGTPGTSALHFPETVCESVTVAEI